MDLVTDAMCDKASDGLLTWAADLRGEVPGCKVAIKEHRSNTLPCFAVLPKFPDNTTQRISTIPGRIFVERPCEGAPENNETF
eukprot:1691304-Amphidinium_carterae.1